MQAGRIMLQRMKELAAQRADFAFETMLAARSYAPWFQSLRDQGYQVRLFYCWVDSPELAIERVALRVAAGGDAVPEDTIRQRYRRSLKNLFELSPPIADVWEIYDNSAEQAYPCVARREAEAPDQVLLPETWKRMQELTGS